MVFASTDVRTISTTKGDVSYTVYDLLEEIKCRPNIWQVDHVDHMSRADFNNSWSSIAQTIVQHFQELDVNEQNQITTELKRVYSKLKNTLMVFINYKKTGDKRYRIFNYGSKMDFVLKDRGIELLDVFSQEDLEEMDLFEKRFKQSYLSKFFNKNLEEVKSIGKEVLCGEMPHCEEINNVEKEYVVKCFRQKGRQNMLQRPKEADQAFLDLIKPWLRRMNEAQKLDFKIEFLHILKKYQN